jgi:hypothetical protein
MLEDENIVAQLLANHGLSAERFLKEEIRSGKTPDFQVFKAASLEFFCEVKTIDKDDSLDNDLDAVSSGDIAGGTRNDPVFNRLTDDIHKAAKQFIAVNPNSQRPNVLVFVNHDAMCDERDMASVLTGQFLTANGTAYSIYSKFSEGRIKDEKFDIHLFCWVEQNQFRSLIFNQAHRAHRDRLCRLLDINPQSITNRN